MRNRTRKFKKLGSMLLTITILMSALIPSMSVDISAATDYSSQVVIEEWDILDSNGVALDEFNEARYIGSGSYQLKFSWSLAVSGNTLQNGDTFRISLPTNSLAGGWTASNSEFENFTSDDNITVLGKWRIYNSAIEVVLNENVEGSYSLEATFTTGTTALTNTNKVGGIQTVTFGNNPKNIMFSAHTLTEASNADAGKSNNNRSNNQLGWWVSFNLLGVKELAKEDEWGKNFTIKNTYFEDTLTGKFDSISFVASLRAPYDLGSGIASNVTSSYPITLTRIYPIANESYQSFKNRLNPLEYGVYTDEQDIDTVIIYYGNIGDNGLKYSDLDSDFGDKAANDVIVNGYYLENDREMLVNYFNTTYGDDNVINGNVAMYGVQINEKYNKVIVDTDKTNTVIITQNGVSKSYSANGTLQGLTGSGLTASAGAGRVYLTDKDSGSILEGVTYKLQYFDGSSWIDTGFTGTTSDEGWVETGTLGLGTYRFVQTSVYSNEYNLAGSDGYDSILTTCISDEFEIASDGLGKVVTMTNVKYKYNVTYDPGSNASSGDGFDTAYTFSNVVVNSTTPTYASIGAGNVDSSGNPIGASGMDFGGWDISIADKVIGTVTYTATWVPKTNIRYTVEHYIQNPDGTWKLEDSENHTGSTGALVTLTSADAKTYTGYYFDSTLAENELSGTITADGLMTLKMYYKARTNTAYQVKHYLEQPSGLYALDDTTNHTGTTGATADAEPLAKTYTGYTFDKTITGTKLTDTIAGDGSLVLELYYKADDVGYKVEHYLQNANGTYPATPYDTETFTTGKTGASISAVVRDLESTGYFYDVMNTNNKITGTIEGDGTSVLKVYYRARTDIAYTVVHQLEQPNGTYKTEDTENLTGTTGATITLTSADAKSYAGYTFVDTIAGSVLTGTVVADGSLQLVMRYSANTVNYTVEHYKEDGSGDYKIVTSDTETLSAKTGTTVTATPKTYTGYSENTGHTSTVKSAIVQADGTTVLKLYYSADTTSYTVEHYKQVDGGTYVRVDADTETLSSKVGYTVTATPKTYTGFTQTFILGSSVPSGTVTAGGGLTLKLYYSADTVNYTVEHYKEDGNGDYQIVTADTETLSSKVGYSVTATPKIYSGYTYDTTSTNTGTVLADGSLILKLYYDADTNISYIEEHYVQNADGTTYTLKDTVSYTNGVTGYTVTATVKTYTGYTENTSHVDRVPTGTVKADGSLVLKRFYDADTVGYKVNHYLELPTGTYDTTPNHTFDYTAKTGTTVTADITVSYAGYTLDFLNASNQWSGTVLGDGSLELHVYYKANTNTPYIVEHYLEQDGGGYPATANQVENFTGTTGATATASNLTFAGYTYDSNSVNTGVIAGDGSLVIKLYYTADEVSYTVEHYTEREDGSYAVYQTDTSLTGKTGYTVNANAMTIAGFTENATHADRVPTGTVLADGSLTLKLYYDADEVGYTVNHYLQQPDGTYGVVEDTEAKTGKTGFTGTATPRTTYVGYTYDASVSTESGVILADGSLVLNLYYEANTDTPYEVNYYLEQPDGTFALQATDSLTGTTGTTVNANVRTYAGYTYDASISTESGVVAGDGSLVLDLYYRANTNTEYKVEHYLQSADGTFKLQDTDTLTATTGHTVTAVANTYANYTLDKTVAGTVESGEVLGDGTLVLKLYYTKDMLTVTGKPSVASNGTGNPSVATGDTTNTLPYTGFAGLSLVAILYLNRKRRLTK